MQNKDRYVQGERQDREIPIVIYVARNGFGEYSLDDVTDNASHEVASFFHSLKRLKIPLSFAFPRCQESLDYSLFMTKGRERVVMAYEDIFLKERKGYGKRRNIRKQLIETMDDKTRFILLNGHGEKLDSDLEEASKKCAYFERVVPSVDVFSQLRLKKYIFGSLE